MAPRRVTAASALFLSLGLSGVVVLSVAPFISPSANAAVAALDPVEPCDVGEDCSVVTITTTITSPPPSEPVVTVTTTVTAPTPSNTPQPAPKKSKTPTPQEQPVTTPPPVTVAPPLPSQEVQVPPTTAPEPSAEEPAVSLPTVEESQPQPTISEQTAQAPESVPLRMQDAAPEYDQIGISRQLGIPALVLVLLALFAVLIFEGRLRRMAHAAAVRKAGPQGAAGRHRADQPDGYPAGPGYAGGVGYQGYAGYPAGTAYAPIISFVPVQTYPGGPTQYSPVYHQEPAAYGQPGYPPHEDPYAQQGYVQEDLATDQTLHEPYVSQEPIVVHDQQGLASDELPSEGYRDPFEPMVPPMGDIPPGGAAPFHDSHDVQEAPPGPVAGAAEAGDDEPWTYPADPEPEPPTPDAPGATMTYPVPDQESPKAKRGFWKRGK